MQLRTSLGRGKPIAGLPECITASQANNVLELIMKDSVDFSILCLRLQGDVMSLTKI